MGQLTKRKEKIIWSYWWKKY